MTPPTTPVRQGRTGATVVITGDGPLARSLAQRLTGSDVATEVLALPWPPSGARSDLVLPDHVDTVVHLAVERSLDGDAATRRVINVSGTRSLLAQAAAAGAARIVLLTSAMVYGASPDNPVPLAEDAPLSTSGRPDVVDDGIVGDWLAVESLAAESSIPVCVVRPAPIVGECSDALVPGLFEGLRLLSLRDARFRWQFCHSEDLVEALALVATEPMVGAVTVGCEGSLPGDVVATISGLRPIVVPRSAALAAAARLHRVGAMASPASDLLYLTEPWVVGSQWLRSAGWAPRWTNETALRDHLVRLGDRAGRGVLGFDGVRAGRAAAGAGATLALVGSLAAARASRRR